MDSFSHTIKQKGMVNVMKILIEDAVPTLKTIKNVVYLNKEIDAIMKKLSDAKFIIGDDKAQIRKLKMAQKLLGELLDKMQDENNHIVYFSGSTGELMNEQVKCKRKKTENVRCMCDTLEELDEIITLLQSMGIQPETITAPLIEARKRLQNHINKLNH